MVRPLSCVLLVWLHSPLLEAVGRERREMRENSRYLQSPYWGAVRTGRSGQDKLERRKLLRKQQRQNTRTDDTEQHSPPPPPTTEQTETAAPVTTTVRIEDNDFPPMMNRKLNFEFEEMGEDQFARVPDIDEPAKHRRFHDVDMPVVRQWKVSKDSSGLTNQRVDWRKNERKEERKKQSNGGRRANFISNVGHKKKYDKNLMKTKLSQYVPDFSNSKKEGRIQTRKAIRKRQKPGKVSAEKYKGERVLSRPVRTNSVNDRIKFRKLKRNQERERERPPTQNKFSKFSKNSKDLRKEKRKQKRKLIKDSRTKYVRPVSSYRPLQPQLRSSGGVTSVSSGSNARQDPGVGLIQVRERERERGLSGVSSHVSPSDHGHPAGGQLPG